LDRGFLGAIFLDGNPFADGTNLNPKLIGTGRYWPFGGALKYCSFGSSTVTEKVSEPGLNPDGKAGQFVLT
jgi:hypothetical protein